MNSYFLSDLGKLWQNYFADYCSLYLQSCPKEGKAVSAVDQESKDASLYMDTFSCEGHILQKKNRNRKVWYRALAKRIQTHLSLNARDIFTGAGLRAKNPEILLFFGRNNI